MLPVALDHCVIHVTDWDRSNAFYTTVLGAELIERPVGFAYRFGDRQLNVHGPGVAPAEVARLFGGRRRLSRACTFGELFWTTLRALPVSAPPGRRTSPRPRASGRVDH